MNILFICRHNRFRSKVGEALFRKYDSKDNVKSAGIMFDLTRPYVAPLVKKVLLDYGVKDIEDSPKKVDDTLINWADKIIVVADNVSSNIFPFEKVEVWPIEDCDENDLKTIKSRVKQIDSFVRKLTSHQ